VESNDLFFQWSLSDKKQELEDAKIYYEEKIIEVKNQREALLNNPDLLEKLAREKYLMKKKNEDIFIIVDEN
jgi:cell division protein FtsB